MKTNAAGLALIQDFEGFVPRWYKDPVGIWTIGFGHTDAAGSPKHATSPNLSLTEGEAASILERDLLKYEADVERLVKVPLNDNQFSALVSFTYNLGAGNLGSSTLLRKLNAGDYDGAANEFPRWNKAGGKVLKGLSRRRAAEMDLFTKPSGRRPAPKPVPAKPARKAPYVAGGIGAVIVAILAWLGLK